MITWDTSVLAVLGTGAAKATKGLAALGIATVGDLLEHFPRRYLTMGELSEVADLAEGQLLTVMGEITRSESVTYTDRRTGKPAYRHEVTVRTEGASLRMTFFAKRLSVAQWQAQRLPVGARGVFTGLVGSFRGEWQLTNPKMVLFSADGPTPDADEAIELLNYQRTLYPLYPATKGLETWDLQRAVGFALSVVELPPDVVPDTVLASQGLPSLAEALRGVHQPESEADIHQATRYFRFREALVAQLVLARRRAARRTAGAHARVGREDGLLAALDAQLPFALTAGQREISAELFAELAQQTPMNRLLQGEVGSGKTVVALRAMMQVVDSGGQAALLAPTEVLASQHHRSLSALLGPLGRGGMLDAADGATSVVLLTGSMPRAAQAEALERIASGEAGIVVGTHALLEERVRFADLGLVVVDEQHRFGVEQRAALINKADQAPHVLVMTATPIPRTVAMTVFGDLEISSLTELPQGRGTVATTVVPLSEQPGWWTRVWERAAEEIAAGRQVYVVCPCISGEVTESALMVDADESGRPLAVGPPAAVETTLTDLAAHPALTGVRMAELHGRLTPERKDATMRAFADGDVDLLVATTVIEVGVDVPNATMMVVLDADRFGISPLHQLRGRVGRGGHDGLCLLVTRAEPTSPARERLAAVATHHDGFVLSQVDLELRR